MGRKPSKWKNLPPRMRARQRKYGTYYYYDTGGTPRVEIPLGSDFVEAVRKWAEMEKKNIPALAHATFIDAADKYVIDILPTKAHRTQLDNFAELENLKEFFGKPPAPLDQIRPIHVRQYMTWRAAKARQSAIEKNKERAAKKLPEQKIPDNIGHVRANREKALFSHIFNCARDWGMTSAPNPATGIKGNKETGRDVYVEDDLFMKVYQHACEPLREAMDLAYLTGQRPSDVLGYSLQDIRENELRVTQEKTGKKLRIAIEGQLADLIERIKTRRNKIGGGKVVAMALIINEDGMPLGTSALRSRFDKAREAAGIEKNSFQFRDLRAKAGTDKTQSHDILTARNQLGHATIAMTEKYVRQRKGDLVKPTK